MIQTTRTLSRGRVMHGSLAFVAGVVALSPLAPAGGATLLLIVAWGESRRSSAVPCYVIVSALYAEQHLGPITVPAGVVITWAAIRCLRCLFMQGVRPNIWTGAAGVLLLVGVFRSAAQTPVSAQGSFIAFEQITLWIAVIGASIHDDLDAERRDVWPLALGGLTITASVGGAVTLNTLAEGAETFAAGRQIEGPLGGSNYVAALLSLVCVAWWVTAVHYRKRAPLALLLAVAFALASFPFASRTSALVLIATVLLAAVVAKRGLLVGTLLLGGFLTFGSIMSSQLLLARRLAEGVNGLVASGRIEIWRFSLHETWKHAFVGLGPGGLADALLGRGYLTGYSHDLPISLCAQYGVPLGLLGVITLTIGPIRRFNAMTAYLVLAAGGMSLFEPLMETLRFGIVYVMLAFAAGLSIAGEDRGANLFGGDRASSGDQETAGLPRLDRP